MVDKRIIAFYLPQYHPFSEMMNGGARDLLNGEMWSRLDLFIVAIISHIYQQT